MHFEWILTLKKRKTENIFLALVCKFLQASMLQITPWRNTIQEGKKRLENDEKIYFFRLCWSIYLFGYRQFVMVAHFGLQQ